MNRYSFNMTMLLSQLIKELQSFLIDNGDRIVGLGSDNEFRCILDTDDLYVITDHVDWITSDICVIANDYYYEHYTDEIED